MLGIPFLDSAITSWFKPQSLDDAVDRMNYFITATLLAFFAVMVSAKQYVGSPIQCWTPQEFKGGWDEYAEDYCFIQNTYYVPMSGNIPRDQREIEQAEISYYQWVPIVLAIQAIMFYLPNWIWKTVVNLSGVDISAAVDDASKLRTQQSSDRKGEIARIANYLEESLGFSEENPRYKKMAMFRYGNGLGSFSTMLYLSIKGLYMLNVLGQFSIMNAFIGHDDGWSWGIRAFNNIINDVMWNESGIFPRVTLCDFDIRKMGNNQRYTVQCVLMINMFNEKIYLFLWFWFFALIVITMFNFLSTVFSFVLAAHREKTVFKLLKSNAFDVIQNAHIIRRFTHEALKPDGILVLRFIESHAGAIITKDITHKLFRDYLEHIDVTLDTTNDYSKYSNESILPKKPLLQADV